MAENLQNHAQSQRDLTAALVSSLRTDLTSAQTALSRRVDDPGAVPPDQWRTQLGAAQYLEAAVARDTALQAAEAQLRRQLAAIPTPADSAQLVADLEQNLQDQTESRVQRRDAQELLAATQAEVGALNAAVAAASALAATAEKYLADATAQQNAITAEQTALSTSPVSDVPADAAALHGDALYTDAETALRARLPDALVDRSEQRYAEAAQVAEHYSAVADSARTVSDQVAHDGAPVDADAAQADRDLAAARAAVRAYTASSVGDLAQVRTTLTRLGSLPALTTDETATLAPDSPRRDDADDAVAALPLEAAVAAAWQTYAEHDRDVSAATFAAVAAHPDADPATDAAVVTATEARDDASVAGALNDAKANYTDAKKTALDHWEAAVPGWLWDAARDFHAASATLARLSDAATVADLTSALDDAIDAVAAAHDAAAVRARAVVRVGLAQARADARATATVATAPQRIDAFVRGDDLGGRHVDEY